MKPERECLIRSLFDQYIEMYASRDDRLTTRFSENFSGYAGSSDQLVTDREEWIRVTRLDFAQVPSRIRIEMRDIALQDLSDNVVAVTAFFHIHLPDPALILAREVARLALVFRLEGEDWKITHSGISIPFGLARAGEVYPIARLHEQNSELLALVDERTKALQKAQDDLDGTLNAIPDLLFDVDLDGRIHGYRARDSELLAVPPDVFMGKRFQDVLPSDAAAICMSALQQANEQGHSAGMYYELLIGQAQKCFELSVSRKGEMTGQGVRFVVLARDITERKLMSERLAGSEARYATLIQTVDGIVWEADAQTFTFTFISEQAERLLGFSTEEWLAPGFWVANLHPDDKSWAPEYCASCTGRLEPHNFEYRFIAKDGRTVWLKDIVTVVAQAGKPRWLRGLMVDVTVSKMAEDALRESNQFNKQIIHDAQEGVVVYGLDLRYQVWNPYMERLTGISAADVLGRHPLEVFPFLKDGGVIDRLDAALAGQVPDSIELPFGIEQTGCVGWAADRSGPFRNSRGEIVGVIATVTDITELKRLELGRIDDEKRYRAYFERSMVGMASISPEKSWIDVNPALCEMLGYAAADLTTKTWAEVTYPDDLATDVGQFNRLFSGEINEYKLNKRFVHSDGRVVYTHLAVRGVRKPDSSLDYLVALVEDITDRKRAEEALRESELRWNFALQGSGDGVWDWNYQAGTAFFSTRWKAMLGHAPDEIGTSAEEWSKRVHPNDLTAVVAALQAHIDGKTASANVEHRLLCKDGSWIWVTGRGMVVSRDSEGKPLRIVGTNTDITERKSAEERLRHMAQHDNLTGLVNRALFTDRLQSAISSAFRDKTSLALMAIDLDKFKPVNDRFGHQVGDLLLQEVARRMVACVRDSDTVARNGGDEFFVLLRNVAVEQDALALAEKIRASLEQPFVTAGHVLHISCCVGVAFFPQHGEDELALSKHADFAMYQAKESGSNQVRLYEEPIA